jgi:hypothetical protein
MKNKFFLSIIIFIHCFLFTKLIYFPYPEFFVYPYLTNQGLKPYSQIWDQHFPGLMFLPINFDNLGMNTAEAARLWSLGIIILTQLLIFLVSRKLLKNERKALIVNLLYLVWQPFFEGFVLWIDSFLPLILLPAFYFSLKFLENKKNYKYLFWAGIFLGVGIIFKQVLVPLTGFLFLYIFWQVRSFKILLFYATGVLLPILIMLIYIYSIGVFKDFWYWTVTFNLTTFADYGRKAPFFSGVARVGFVLIFSGLIIFLKDKVVKSLLAIFIFGSLLAIYARFDFVHFQPALPFVLIATVLGFDQIKKQALTKMTLVFYIIVIFWWQTIFLKGHVSNKILFFDEEVRQISEKIKNLTNPREKIFIFGSVPHIYQITQTLPAGDNFVFQFPWFVQVSEDRLLDGLKKDAPNIIVSNPTVEIEGRKIIDYASKIYSYIQQNYEQIDAVGDNRILRKKLY